MKIRWMVCFIALCTVFFTGCSIHSTEKAEKNEVEADTKVESATATPAEENPADKKEDNSSTNDITMDAAKEIALKQAGLTEQEGNWTKEKRERDDGRMVYELEFVSGEMEYDFEIDGESGKILEYEKDSIYD